MVASVYYNRLDKNMLLGADPSVVYAALLAGRYRGTIYQSDLQYDSPYNTYKYAGLPPGPIANPGAARCKRRCIRLRASSSTSSATTMAIIGFRERRRSTSERGSLPQSGGPGAISALRSASGARRWPDRWLRGPVAYT